MSLLVGRRAYLSLSALGARALTQLLPAAAVVRVPLRFRSHRPPSVCEICMAGPDKRPVTIILYYLLYLYPAVVLRIASFSHATSSSSKDVTPTFINYI